MDHYNSFYDCDGDYPRNYHMGCGQSICGDCVYSEKRQCRKCKKCSNWVSGNEMNRCDHCSSFVCYECENPLNSSNLHACADKINENVWSDRHDIDKLRQCDECNKAACYDCQLKFGKSVGY